MPPHQPNHDQDLPGDSPSDIQDVTVLENRGKHRGLFLQGDRTKRVGGCIGWVLAWIIVIIGYTLLMNDFPVIRAILIGVLFVVILFSLLRRLLGSVPTIFHFVLNTRFFSPFHPLILQKRYHVIAHKTLRQKTLAAYNKVNQPFFLLLLKFLHTSPYYLQQLGPVAQQLIHRCKETEWEIGALNDVYDYYHSPTNDLIAQYLYQGTLSGDLRERIVFEADMSDRQLLERQLSPGDPLLTDLYTHHHVGVADGFQILK